MNKIFFIFDKINASKKIVPFLSIIFFLVITLPLVIEHIPHFDEVTAWHIARYINPINFIHICGDEGHGIIWYLLLKPFATFDLFYPYPMLIINFLACFSAILFMWKKAPFDNIVKILFTFSFTTLYYYAVVARCYSIGILGLFLLAHFYKQSINRPILFSNLIGLTLNTSAMAMIGANAFTILFLFDIFKNKATLGKVKIIKIFSILFCYYMFFFLPIFMQGSQRVFHRSVKSFDWFFEQFSQFFLPQSNFLFPFALIGILIYFLFYKRNNKSLFFLYYTFIALFLFVIFIFDGELYHRFFYFIFIILAVWLKSYNIQKNTILLYILLGLLFFTPYNIARNYGDKAIPSIASYMKQNNAYYTNSILFFSGCQIRLEVVPYLSFDKTIVVDDNGFSSGLLFDTEYDFEDNIVQEKIQNFARKTDRKVFALSKKVIENWEKMNFKKTIVNNVYIYEIDM